MAEQRQRRVQRDGGRFHGFRVNCETVPLLPASAVRVVWDDPRQIPYLFIWKSELDDQLKECVRVKRCPSADGYDAVEVKRANASVVTIYLVWRELPCGGRFLLLRCRRCGSPCRALFGYRVGKDGRFYAVERADWPCRTCAGLRYASEGGHLRSGILLRDLGNLPRPDPWPPYVFTSPQQASEAGFCNIV